MIAGSGTLTVWFSFSSTKFCSHHKHLGNIYDHTTVKEESHVCSDNLRSVYIISTSSGEIHNKQSTETYSNLFL